MLGGLDDGDSFDLFSFVFFTRLGSDFTRVICFFSHVHGVVEFVIVFWKRKGKKKKKSIIN